MTASLRVLIVEDSETDAILLGRALGRETLEAETARVESLEEFQTALDTREWDAILADYSLPGFTAADALAEVRKRGIDVPFLVVSGSIGEETAAGLMRAGAHDYILKDHLGRLGPALRRELADAAARRAARDAEARLQAAEAQLAQARSLEAVARLAGGIAHDFNNLLTVIAGNAHLLSEEVPPDREEVADIVRAAERAQELTRQLLAFTKQEVRRPATFDLGKMLVDLGPALDQAVGEAIRVDLKVSADPVPVLADPQQIERAIMSLVTNAREAMPDGGVLHLSASRREAADAERASGQAGQLACLEVSDTGTGIPVEYLDRVFEPFFTTKRESRRPGLGLATVFGIVSQSGGSITVENRQDGGARFRILLPIHEPAREGGEGTAETAARDVRDPGAHEAATVLLVDDDPAVRGLARRVLERAGMAVVEAAGAKEAVRLQQALGTQIDLILTDMIMPGMGGRELADEVRRMRPDMPVIFMSGYTEDQLLRSGDHPEGTAFLEKPFTPTLLLERICDMLRTS